VVLRRSVRLPSGGDRLRNQIVNLRPVITRQGDQHLVTFVASLIGSEKLLEVRMRQQHRVNVIADDHARGVIIL